MARLPDFASMRRATPARLDVGRAGTRYTTQALLRFRADHARAIDAVMTEVSPQWIKRSGLLEVRSRAATREDYLLRPHLGRMLSDEDAARVRRLYRSAAKSGRALAGKPSVLICVGDGLS